MIIAEDEKINAILAFITSFVLSYKFIAENIFHFVIVIIQSLVVMIFSHYLKKWLNKKSNEN